MTDTPPDVPPEFPAITELPFVSVTKASPAPSRPLPSLSRSAQVRPVPLSSIRSPSAGVKSVIVSARPKFAKTKLSAPLPPVRTS